MEQRKGKKQKALLAASLGEKKDTTRSSIEQFANRLEIEHPAGLREATTLHRTSKEGAKSIAADEKMPISQTWYHSMKIKKKTFVFFTIVVCFDVINSVNKY